MVITLLNTKETENGVSEQKRMTDMKFTSLSAAAALLAACLATTCATPAFAAGEPDAPPGPHGFGDHGPGAPGPDMPFGHLPLHRLKLTEAQQDKLFAFVHGQAPQRREHDKAIRKAHEALRELGRADKFDDAAAGTLARDLGQAVAAQALLQARTEAQMLAVLTPEQRDQLRQHRLRGRDGAERQDGPPDRR
jgi:Spy/CpxP family protein refolding chaperone